MSSNGVTMSDETDMGECDGEKVVTMMDVLQEQEEFEEDANAVLGASDDKNCTYPKGYIKRQAIYACLTCCDAKTDPSKRAGVCLACSLMCHENHELIELYTKRNFACDCGNPKFNSHPCQFTPNKTDLNENNTYNQNFSGLYCVCHRPYPDPESPIEDEMIQCIICEDWLHASHLEATVPANEHYSEMICKACMEKNDFLHDYSKFAVNTECGDVDIISVDHDASIVSDISVTNGKLDKEVVNGSGHIDITDKADNEENNVCKTENDTTDINNKKYETETQKPDEIQKIEEGKSVIENNVSVECKKVENSSSADAVTNEVNAESNTTVPEVLNNETEEHSITEDQPMTHKNEVKNNEALTEIDKLCSDNVIDAGPNNDIAQKELSNISTNDITSVIETNTSVPETNDDDKVREVESASETNLNKQEDNIVSGSSEINNDGDVSDEKSEQKNYSSENNESISMNTKVVDNNKTEELLETNNDLTIEINNTSDIPLETTATQKENNETNIIETSTNMKDDYNTVDNTNISETTNLKDSKDVDMIDASNEQDVARAESQNSPDNTDSLVNSNEKQINNNDQKQENKRRLSEESLQDNAAKKPKLDGVTACARPRGVKKIFKGATFWPSNFRQKLCTCSECISMYKDLSVLFLIDDEDTVTAYETLGKERTEGNSVSQYEKGLQALSSLDRIQQINALTEYNKMRDKLLDFLQSFKDRKEIVKEEDIKAFFAGIKAKREPDGVYFCR